MATHCCGARFLKIGVTHTFTRYAVVGMLSNLSAYLVYLLVTSLGVEPKMAMTLLYILGAAIGFFGNRQWAFEHKGSLMGAGWRYLLVHLAGYLLNLSILLAFVDVLGFPHQLVQAIAIGLVAGFLYLLFKYYVFPKTGTCVGVSDEKMS